MTPFSDRKDNQSTGQNASGNNPSSRPASVSQGLGGSRFFSQTNAPSPLETLLSSVKNTVDEGRRETQSSAEGQKEAVAPKKPAVKEQKPVLKNDDIPVAVRLFQAEKEDDSKKAAFEPKNTVKTSSLLAKCMPFISDEQGNSYVEEKPDYTLQSVENIIESAEKRADERIARMYNLKPSDIQRIGTDTPHEDEEPVSKPKLRLEENSFKKPLKIGDVAVSSSKYDTVSFPKLSNTLFDDFSARRTEIDGEEKVSTPYSEVVSQESNHTRIIPDLVPKTNPEQIYEDISSRSAPETDVWSSSKKQKNKVKNLSQEAPEVQTNEFRGAADIYRVGGDLKLDLVLARARFFITSVLAVLAGALYLPVFEDVLSSMASVVAIVAFSLAVIVNYNIFGSFKGAFTKDTKASLPLAFALTLMAIYFVVGIINASYPFEYAFLPLASLAVYDYCSYRKASAIFGNFKIVASRKGKQAITLIDDPATTSAMARSAVKGEVVAASSRPTDEISDFLRNTLSDRSLSSMAGVFTAVSLVAAAVVALVVGVSHASFSNALLAAAVVMCFSAAPSLFIADSLPFASLCDRLHRLKAGVCSKFSAEQIEQSNAIVVSSRDLFPKGCIKLYNMSPLSANPIDETITLAASVAYEAKSPLYPLFASILTGDTELFEADSVKYEENLGISGWADDRHIMIGNRSLMEAHGVRVPALDVDRKILHKGFFPVYLACDQRACAMFVVKYSIDRDIETELGRLADRNVTILVENCDPNITEQMLCDYYSLYPDSLKILDHNGTHKHQTATAPVDTAVAHGFHKGSALGFLSAVSGSFRLRTLSNVLYILHIITMVITWLLFACLSLGGAGSLMSISICALCELVSAVILLTAYFIGK